MEPIVSEVAELVVKNSIGKHLPSNVFKRNSGRAGRVLMYPELCRALKLTWQFGC